MPSSPARHRHAGGETGPLGSAEYELDASPMRPGEVVSSGEIRMEPEAPNEAFGRRYWTTIATRRLLGYFT
jgi:hypothetical protein